MEPSVAVPRAGPLEISTFYFQKDFPELSVVIKGEKGVCLRTQWHSGSWSRLADIPPGVSKVRATPPGP